MTAVLDDWDPRTIDGVAQKHRVIAFNNRGVGGSKGTTPDTIDNMATDAVAFIRALGLSKTDLLGFSLGGFIAQVIAQKHPDLVRRMILAGTSAAGGEGISNVASVLQNAVARATAEKEASEAVALFHTVSRRPEGGCGISPASRHSTTGPRFACNTRDHRCSGDRDYQVGHGA